jgi:transposase
MSKTAWVGIDVGKQSFYAAVAENSVIPRQWASLPANAFEHSARGLTQFLKWIGCLDCVVEGICIEATGRYTSQWVDLLKGRLGPVCIVNPARPKAFAKSLGIRDKSDRVDACVIALYAVATRPKPTTAHSSAQRELRELCRLHHALQEQCQANQQRLLDGSSSSFVRSTLKKTIADLQRQMRRIEQAMDNLIRSDKVLDEDFKRAKTVKGIGTKTATIILAEFGDLRRYNRDEVVALAGLYPREYSSGTSVRKKSRLAKAGRTPVRAALYMCAMSAIQADPKLGQFAGRLLANGKHPMQVLAAVMRKLLMLVRACIVNQTDYDPNYQHTLQSQTA